MMKKVIEIGKIVICDICSTDYTNSSETGGILFGSKAACPICYPDLEESAKKYNEEHFINGRCPKDMSFAKWVLSLRGGDNTVTIESF